MKFKQVAIAEFRQDSIGAYDISSSGFRVALLGATGEIPALELCASGVIYGSGNHCPFNIDQVIVPQERPCSKIVEHLELPSLYVNCTAQQSQELTLDPVYVANYSSDPPKPKVQQLEWSPLHITDTKVIPTVALLTSYGSCQLRTKDITSRRWNRVMCDINKLYLQDVFPFDLTSLQKVCDLETFKNIADLHLITAFAWHQKKTLFYTANALGWIVAFRYETTLENMRVYFKLKTKLRRISYMLAFDDFVLIADFMGVVKVFKLIGDEKDATLIEVECLWSKQDRMPCRKAEATFSKDINCYYVVFSKAAHVLGYQLGDDGVLLSSCILYVGGIKITGIGTFSCNEFIVTTITGAVKHLKLEPISDSRELQISEQIISTDLDINNHQILGVAATPNKNLWSFLLYRNKDYHHQSKYTSFTAFLSVCNVTSIDSLEILFNLNVKTMNPFMDYAVAIRLDIVNNIRPDDYNSFYQLQNARFPVELNDAFLQKLQLKLMIVRSQVIFETENYKSIKKITSNSLDFLLGSIEATYIICRMQELQHNIKNKGTTIFQNLAGSCLRRRFYIIIRNLQGLLSDESNLIKDTTERFIKLATETVKKIPADFRSSEKCLLCQELIDGTTMMCATNHKVRRCCVSYVQVPFLNRRFCVQCNEVVIDNDSQLLEILAPDEVLKCTFCRFNFVNDSI